MAWWYNLETNSKWNSEEFTKPFGGFCRRKKNNALSSTGKSLHGEKAMLEYPKVPSLVLYCFWFTLMILQKTSLLMQSYLQVILSLFSVVHETPTSANDVSKDLEIINNWAFQWERKFIEDPTKQAHEVSFSRKAKQIYYQ